MDGGADPPPASGVRVERTGIALVHEGDYIGPELPSTALVSPVTGAAEPDPAADRADGPGDREVHYYFPIDVEVVGSSDPGVIEAVVARVFEELQREMASRP
jgi:hypothetical protein